MRSRVLPAVLLFLICISPFPPTGASAQRAAVLLRDRQVSIYRGHPADACRPGGGTLGCVQLDTEVEPSIAVDPEDPLRAVAVFQEGRYDEGGAADNGFAVTQDGGRSWRFGDLPGVTRAVGGPAERASDPAVAFGPHHVVYAQSLTLGPGSTSAIVVNVSRNGGRSWSSPVTINAVGATNDKNWITVDVSREAGHHYGRAYAVWDRRLTVVAAYSDDQGRTWQTGGSGFIVYPGPGIGALPLVLRNGDLGVLFSADVAVAPALHQQPGDELAELRPGLTKFVIAKAPRAGSLPTGAPLVFGPPVTVGTSLPNPVGGQRAGEGLAAAVVDPVSGAIYAAWTDGRFRTDPVNDIVMTSSQDAGLTWTPLVRVNRGSVTDQIDHWCPMISASGGSVQVAYRQRNEFGGVPPLFPSVVQTIYQRSNDGGRTFSRPVNVSRANGDVRYGAVSRGALFLGDYDQMASQGGLTYIARAEAFKISAKEDGTYPPSFHHQSIWVAVVSAPRR